MGLRDMLAHKSSPYEPDPWVLRSYCDFFDRLDAIMAQAEQEGKQSWNVHGWRKCLADVNNEFQRVKLPERTTAWQVLLADNCLHPLCETDEEIELVTAVVRVKGLIGFWKSILECQARAIGITRATSEAIDEVMPELAIAE